MTALYTRCGFVAILGRPNVGKSTLLNRLVGQKLSITASKPQTTRHTIVGIETKAATQTIYVDTPGIHRSQRRALNRYLNRAAAGALSYADVVVAMVQAGSWSDDDERVLDRLREFRGVVIAAANKVDKLSDKKQLLPFMHRLATHLDFAHIVPVSATHSSGLDTLRRCIDDALPPGPFRYPAEQVTTVSERFLAAEFLREKLTRLLRDELPYALTVDVERFHGVNGVTHIDATVWVERDSQKAIVIGQGGSVLREAGRQARLALEQTLECRVALRTWVKVREGWSDNEQALQSLGYVMER